LQYGVVLADVEDLMFFDDFRHIYTILAASACLACALPLAAGCRSSSVTPRDSSETDADVDTDTDSDVPDDVDPSITLTSPVDEETVSGIITMTADASDNVGVAFVRFLVGTDEIATDIDVPWETEWATTDVYNGNYVVSALAADAKGNEAISSASIIVENDSDLPLGTVRIINPIDGAIICGSVTVEAAVSSTNVNVTFALDDADMATDASSPYQWSWDTTSSANGVHAIRATAVDGEGRGEQETITIDVENTGAACDNNPSVVILAPESDAWVHGDVSIDVAASDDIGVMSVQFFVDLAILAEDTSVPFGAVFPSDGFGEGPHSIKVVATDTASQSASTQINLNVDHTPPEVTIDTPADEAALQGVVPITATASDNFEVASVAFAIDGTEIGSVVTPPYTIDWDTAANSWGPHTVVARAIDLAGNEATDTIGVTIDNPPSVTIVTPSDDETVGGIVVIEADATDDDLITAVHFFIDDVEVVALKSGPYTYTWDTCSAFRGSHLIEVIAIDSAGYSRTDLISVTVDQPLSIAFREPETGVVGTSQDVVTWTMDDTEITNVVYGLDGEAFVTLTSSDGTDEGCSFDCSCELYSYTWDTSDVSEGTHSLEATVTNSEGDTAFTSVSIEVRYDHDGDGYDDAVYGGTDCNDDDPSIHPGVAEICDGIDEDCDGALDNGFDVDADGFPSETLCSWGTDCDDAVATTYPGATESCDGIDNDCDGYIDSAGLDWTTSTGTFGDASSRSTSSGYTYGNIYLASESGTLDSFSVFVDPTAVLNLYFRVMESTTRTGTYAEIASTTTASTTSEGWYDSGAIAATLVAGRYYFVGVSYDGSLDDLFYDSSASLTAASGLTPEGYDYASGYTGITISGGPYSTTRLMYQAIVTTVAAEPTDDVDGDGDGMTPFCGDCDDSLATVYDGATEACDGIDNDCDGTIDEAIDTDGDGYSSCDDCDDTDADINPGATEVCDDIDNDCDGYVDTATPTLTSYTGTFGDTTTYWDETGYLYGNLFLATEGGTIDSFSAYIDPYSSATVYFRVMESTTLSGTYTQIASGSASTTSTETWYSSGTLDARIVAGRYYFLGVGSSTRLENVFYDSSASMTASAGLTPQGYDRDTSYTSTTVSGGPLSTSYLLYQRVYTTLELYTVADTDGDGDGVTPTCGDCDDDDATSYPDATEVCDEVDNDCDGTVDEGFDGDGDGYASCSDCDDTDARIHPGSFELCDWADNDCDGTVDIGAIGGSYYYADTDGDGYGDYRSSLVLCRATSGWSLLATDCDDDDATIHPGATETCDSVDEDCDGSIDEGFDADGDGYASCVDCNDARADINPGEAEVCDGIDNDCDTIVDANSVDTYDYSNFGDTSSSATTSSYFYGNVYEVSEDTTLASFDMWINPDSTATAYFVVLEATSRTGTYSRLDYSSVSITGGSTWYNSGSLDVDLTAGRFYLIGVGTSASTLYYYDDTPSLTASSSFTPIGYDYSTSTASPSTISTDPSAIRLYYQRLAVGGLSVDDRDADADGYSVFCGDCLDSDATAYPGAAEACDGVDDDCDGTTDEGYDVDGDGYKSLSLCSSGVGSDCDDTLSSVHPGATETCNDRDDDCDGTTDEDDASDATTWYRDVDGDGYGRTGVTYVACDVPSGYAATSTDCDDDDATSHPGASEICDGADNDCDSSIDEGFTDADGDGYASCVDCNDTIAARHPGAYDICENSIDEDCSGADRTCGYSGTIDLGLSAVVKLWGESASDYAGLSVAGLGDVNADGYDDIVVAAYGDDDGGSAAGAAYLVSGPITTDRILSSSTVKMVGEDASDYAGYAVAGPGDVDCDGYADILIGAYGDDDGGSAAGAAYVVLGSLTSRLDLSAADAKLIGEDASDDAGNSVAGAGDVLGDGCPDVLVGAIYDDSGATDAGAAYLVSGSFAADLDLSLADAKLYGENASDEAGIAESSAGDVDADGFDDVVVGAFYNDAGGTNAGAVYLMYGPIDGSHDLTDADVKLTGEDASDYAGLSVAAAGDIDLDGYDDFLVGAYGDDDGGSSAGAVYVLLGPVLSDRDLSAADAKVTGADTGHDAGYSVAGSTDVDGDGYPDILVGAYGADGGGTDSGAAYLVYGPVTADVSLMSADTVFVGEDASDDAGIAVAGAGDLDHDGYGDLLVGAYYDDTSGTNCGAVYVLPFSLMP
jgi:hypothetical protein